MLLFILLAIPPAFGDVTRICQTEDAVLEVSLLDTATRDWIQAKEHCENESKGELVRLDDSHETKQCVEEVLRNATRQDAANDGQAWWTAGRFDCPSIQVQQSGSSVAFGPCDARKSFVCQYADACRPVDEGQTCVTVDDRCLCVHDTSLLSEEATWIEAVETCIAQNGILAEVTSEEMDRLAAILSNTGRYWIGLSAEERYSYYDTRGTGSFCESITYDGANGLSQRLSNDCDENQRAICVKYTGGRSTEATREQTDRSTMEKSISSGSSERMFDTLTGILVAIVAITSLLLIVVIVLVIILVVRRKRKSTNQKGSVPYDGITFFKYDESKESQQNNSKNAAAGGIYSEIKPYTSPKLKTEPPNKSGAPHKASRLVPQPPDVIQSMPGPASDMYTRDSRSDITLPSNIPTMEVANVVVQRELNKNKKKKQKAAAVKQPKTKSQPKPSRDVKNKQNVIVSSSAEPKPNPVYKNRTHLYENQDQVSAHAQNKVEQSSGPANITTVDVEHSLDFRPRGNRNEGFEVGENGTLYI